MKQTSCSVIKGASSPYFLFSLQDCGKEFSRKDKLVSHGRICHAKIRAIPGFLPHDAANPHNHGYPPPHPASGGGGGVGSGVGGGGVAGAPGLPRGPPGIFNNVHPESHEDFEYVLTANKSFIYSRIPLYLLRL